MSYIEKAISALHQLGIAVKEPADAPIMPLVERLSVLNADEALHVARILSHSQTFNAAVREQIGGMDISNRYEQIVAAFNSVRDDLNQMVTWLDDGKLDWMEKTRLRWQEFRRGSIADRFNDIRTTYLDVSKASLDQIQRERTILEAYQDFRFSLKEGQISAQRLLAHATERKTAQQTKLTEANSLVAQATSGEAKAQADLGRDEALRAMSEDEKRYQIALDMANNLQVAYSTAEAVFARLQQTLQLKERVYEQAISFFGTNEVVFTALAATFSSTQGLSESTNTLEAMKQGVNQSLELLGELGNQQLEASVKAGYGATISAQSVKKLTDAIVGFQERSSDLIKQLRVEATENAQEIEKAVDDAKTRFVALTQGA